MHKQRIRCALIQGGSFGLVLTLIKGIIHTKRLGFNNEWLTYTLKSGLVFIIGSIILYYLFMWPLKKYLDKKTVKRYQKEIEEDSKK